MISFSLFLQALGALPELVFYEASLYMDLKLFITPVQSILDNWIHALRLLLKLQTVPHS